METRILKRKENQSNIFIVYVFCFICIFPLIILFCASELLFFHFIVKTSSLCNKPLSLSFSLLDGRSSGQVRGGHRSFRQCPVMQLIQLPPINGDEGGVSNGRFSTKKKNTKNMGLKYWILPNNHFKTHLFFQFLCGVPFSAQILVRKVGSNLKVLWRSHLKTHIIQNSFHGAQIIFRFF